MFESAGQKIISIVTIAVLLLLLYLSSFYNYLLFHSLAEVFSIVVAFMVFMLVWNSMKYLRNNYLILIGIAYLFIGFFDLLHTLGYTGMNIFKDYDFYGNQLWIASRYMESITLFLGFFFLKLKKIIHPYYVFGTYFAITAVVLSSIFYFRTFPICFIEGVGQTQFKLISEYIICFILFLSIAALYKSKSHFDGKVFLYLLFSIVFTIVSELAFTFYISNYGFSNLVGHYFKIFSFYLIYKSIIETGIIKPYDLIFKDLVDYQTQLAAAKEAAEAANRHKSEFLSSISHEIRTPLNSMLGFTSILMENEASPERQDMLKIVSKSGQHLISLINELLDFAKIESSKIELEFSTFSLHKLMEEVKNIFVLQAFEKRLALDLFIDESVPNFIIGDVYRFKQVLINIIGNAIKFTSRGHVFIKCSMVENIIHINIEDTGSGIPQEKLQSIFNAFEQADSSISREYGGTGLGLAISQKLISLMGGDIEVQSEMGRGSTFTIKLALMEPDMETLIEEYNLLALEHDDIKNLPVVSYVIDAHMINHTNLANIRNMPELTELNIICLPYSSKLNGVILQKDIDMIIADSSLATHIIDDIVNQVKKDFRMRHIPVVNTVNADTVSRFNLIYQNAELSYISTPVDFTTVKGYFSTIYDIGESIVNKWSQKAKEDLSLSDIVQINIASLPTKLKALENSIWNNDKSKMLQHSHSMRGAAGNTRMEELSESLAELEGEADKEYYDIEKIKNIFSEIKQLVKHIPKKYYTASYISQLEEMNVSGLSKHRILLVEDNEMNQKLMKFILEDFKLEYEIAHNGRIALEMLDVQKYDAILMDSHMPVMNGIETLKRIKQNPRLRNIPVIIMSADLNRDNIEKYYELGCKDYISKPIDRRGFKQKLEEVLV
ncbi:MAG: MASE3 domain-containing protein [Bacillota bacterium]